MARRSDHSREELREMALNAAELLLDEMQLPAISTRQIAAKMGYTVGTLYQIYKNLPDLLIHVNSRSIKQLHQCCLKEHDISLSASENIQHYALTYVDFSCRYQSRWRLIFDHDVIEQIEKPEWYQEQISELFALIALELKRIRPDASSEQLEATTHLLWSSIHGICSMSLNQKVFACEIDKQALIKSLVRNFVSGWQHDVSPK